MGCNTTPILSVRERMRVDGVSMELLRAQSFELVTGMGQIRERITVHKSVTRTKLCHSGKAVLIV